MANQQLALDAAFHALADPTRRAVVQRLAKGPASVSDLAEPFDMAMPTFLAHVRVLEKGGLIRTRKQGRVRTCEFAPEKVAAAQGWLAEQRKIWEGRLDRLEDYIASLSAADATPQDKDKEKK